MLALALSVLCLLLLARCFYLEGLRRDRGRGGMLR